MALTVVETTAVNTVLDWMLDYVEGQVQPTPDEAHAAARVLAARAHHRLHAGITAAQVTDRFPWPEEVPF